MRPTASRPILRHGSGHSLFALAVLLLTLALCPIASAGVSTPDQALAALNAQRATNGLPANVTLNSDWSTDCALHNHYLALYGWGGDSHTEDPNAKGYTSGGDWAARRSVLASGLSDWATTGDPFEDAPFHLSDMLMPQLNTIGWASSEGFTCMVVSGVGLGGPTNRIYTYPGNGVSGFYYSENASEYPITPNEMLGLPNPTGPNIMVFADGPWAWASYPQFTQASLVGPDGAVAVKTLDGNDPAAQSYRWMFTAMGLIIPTKPLKPRTTYHASVTMTTDSSNGGGQVSYSWSFTTGSDTMPSSGDSSGDNGSGGSGGSGGTGGSGGSPAHVRARLSKTTFSRTQASAVKLTYFFTSTSSFFSYELDRAVPGFKEFGRCDAAPERGRPLPAKHCTAWNTVSHVRKVNGQFRGPYTLAAKRLFGDHTVSAGRYRLLLRSDADVDRPKVVTFTVVS